MGGKFTHGEALGILSLMIWTLIITISIKYCLFVMRADNRGEGGILALMSLVGANGFTPGLQDAHRHGTAGSRADLRRRRDHAGDLGAERARGRQRRDRQP